MLSICAVDETGPHCTYSVYMYWLYCSSSMLSIYAVDETGPHRVWQGHHSDAGTVGVSEWSTQDECVLQFCQEEELD